MPFKRARTDEALAEERRLLYVGMTRARRHLSLTWSFAGRKPSRFLKEVAAAASGLAEPTPPSVTSRRMCCPPQTPGASLPPFTAGALLTSSPLLRQEPL